MEKFFQAVEPLRLSESEFLETFKKVPRMAVNLLVTDSQGGILLTRRSIPPQAGSWHYPGGFLLKNESILECQRRVAGKELGLNLDSQPELKLVGVFEDLDKDPRGHVVDVMYGLQVDNQSSINVTAETSEYKFFKKIPKDMGFNHQDTLIKLGYQIED